MGKTHSKPLVARHGRGTAWARHVMCESANSVTVPESLTCSLLHLLMVMAFDSYIAAL